MNPNIQVIGFRQVLNDRVKYMTNETDSTNSMHIDKFIPYLLTNFYIKNRDELIKELKSFSIITLNTLTGEWEVDIPNIDTNIPFEELKDIQRKKKESETNELDTRSKIVDNVNKNVLKKSRFLSKIIK